MSKYLNVELLSADVIWIVSDGGVTENTGYYGWVIADSYKILFEGSGITLGNPDQMDSLRAESSSMLHIMLKKRKKLLQKLYPGEL